MIVSNKEKSPIYLPNDFDRINNKYFRKLYDEGNVKADPSFWHNSESKIINGDLTEEMVQYRSDYGSGIKKEKEIFINLINRWDENIYDYNNITVCNSITAASTIIMSFLKEKNIKKIYFETPTYYASVDQANMFNFETFFISTYSCNNFQIIEHDLRELNKTNEAKAIWLTQPRFALGINQNLDTIEQLINGITDKDFIIIDEATEQMFPSYLRTIFFSKHPSIIKLRSFFKPIGINGPRISYILHHERYRRDIERLLEVMQGAIDCFSLKLCAKILSTQSQYEIMLQSVNSDVVSKAKEVRLITKGTSIINNNMTNGYIGSIGVPLPKVKSYFRERELLLKHCYESGVPIIIGSSMNFAKDDNYEFVRINFFNTRQNIIQGVRTIIDFTHKYQ